MKITLHILFAALAAGVISGCANDDDYATPVLECIETTLSANLSPQEVPAVATPTLYTGNGIIEAYVTSSDLSGNFFKTISLQTLDGTFGFSILADVTATASQFEPGRKVLVALNGTYTDVFNGSLRIGTVTTYNALGRLSPDIFKTVVNRTCTVVKEDELVSIVTLPQATIDNRINTLVEFQNVRFTQPGGTFYDEGNTVGGATNLLLEDEQGNQIIFRTSSFASFASAPVPAANGNVRGVLTKFCYANGECNYQLMARYESDIMIAPGSTIPINPNNPSASALGGSGIIFSGAFTEDFEDYAVGQNEFAGYINDYDPNLGNRYWQLKQYPLSTGNKFIEMTSFYGNNNPGEAAKSYFFVPVDFTAATTFTFDKQIRYMAGQALKVYYVTIDGYEAGNQFDAGTFTDITPSFTGLTYPATGNSENSFTNAGIYTLPETLTGNGYFVFEYTGTQTITTTIQIDDIIIN